MSAKFQISTRAMQSSISKLHLERGDVILCKNHETMRYLSEVHMPLDFTVPLVFAPEGLQKLTRQDLLNLLEQLDQEVTPAPQYAEMPSAPL